jgi:hypothetical protein
MRFRYRGSARLLAGAIGVLLLGATGCSSNLYPVRGTVTFEDGTPLPAGGIIFLQEGGEKAIQAQGSIRPDGRYELGTNRPGDGAAPGKYRVLINPGDMADWDPKVRSAFDRRYLDFSTSGLEFEVKPAPNEFNIQLTRAGKRSR